MIITETAHPKRSMNAWLNQARQGDPSAFCELVEPLHATLLRQSVALGCDPDTAADLVQQTLLEGWRSLARYHGGCRLSTWLYAILLHRFYKHLRTQRRRPISMADLNPNEAAHGETLLQNIPAEAPSPAEKAMHIEECRAIQAQVLRLSFKHQQVILLRFMEQASLAEIAAALECSLGTVKSRLHHALRQLRKMNLSSSSGDTPL